MVDVDPFLTTLYVLVDDFCMLALSPAPHPGGYPLKAGHRYTPMFQASKATATSDGHAVHC